MNVLIVQRKYMHYRKLLLNYLKETSELNITVIDTNKLDNKFEAGYISLKSNVKIIKMFGKKYELNYSPEVINYIRENCKKYDVVILEGATNIVNNVFITRILKHNNVPYIWWGAGRRVGAKMTPARKLAQPIIKRSKVNANACIAYSTVAKDYMSSVGVPEENIFVCQNTLNVGHFDEQISSITQEMTQNIKAKYNFQDKKVILYVGALEKRKRVEDLIKAFVGLGKDNYGLLIVGGGDYQKELVNLCDDIKANNIVFAGEIIEESISYFMACDVFALPSEGGLALNQAMICGKPIIASSADGTERDLIEEGKNGYLFEEGNIEQLKECLLKVLENNLQLGKRSREIIEDRVNEKEFKTNFIKAIEFAVGCRRV